jgi:hypothetical protein
MKRIITLSVRSCLLLLGASTCLAQMYTIADLGAFGGASSEAAASTAAGRPKHRRLARTGTRGSSSCARRTFSTKRPDTFSQTVLVYPILLAVRRRTIHVTPTMHARAVVPHGGRLQLLAAGLATGGRSALSPIGFSSLSHDGCNTVLMLFNDGEACRRRPQQRICKCDPLKCLDFVILNFFNDLLCRAGLKLRGKCYAAPPQI